MKSESQVKQKGKIEWFAVYSHASGFSVPLGGLKMRLINVFSFYKLGACIGGLKLIGSLDRELSRDVFYAAKQQLANLRSEKLASLAVLSHAATGIEVDIDEAKKSLDGAASAIYGGEEERLQKSIKEFEAIFEAQAPWEHTYTVEQLRGFSMPILVDSAEKNFSDMAVFIAGEEVKKDIQQAGRCLAFELPTASGIHMMRAFEKVLRRFYKSITGKEAGDKGIWKLLDELKDRPGADVKTLNVLDQIRNLHRNPLAHEVFLTMDEAVDLFDIAKSAIIAMTKRTLLTP
jgi:hypothetical protein